MNLRLHVSGRPWLCVAPLVAAVFLVVSAPSAAQAATRVDMRNFQFRPAVVRIEPGKRVLWVNGDAVRHDAVQASVFDTGLLRRGESAAVRFTRRGVYPYICSLHPYYMRGKVIVG